MNGLIYGHDLSAGFYTGNGPIHPSYQNYYPSTFTPGAHLHQYTRQDFSNTQQTNDFQQQFYTNSYQQPLQQPLTNPNVYNFETSGAATLAYYDNIHARVRSNQHKSSISTNSSIQYPYTQSPVSNTSERPTSANANGQTDPMFLVVPGTETTEPPTSYEVIDHTNRDFPLE